LPFIAPFMLCVLTYKYIIVPFSEEGKLLKAFFYGETNFLTFDKENRWLQKKNFGTNHFTVNSNIWGLKLTTSRLG